MENIICNKWFFTFLTGWAVFLFLVDLRTLSKNIWGGIIACILELWEDSWAYSLGIYFIHEPGLVILNVSAFFTFGITAAMGILYMQFIPENQLLQIIHLLAFNIGFIFFEYAVKEAGLLTTPHWNLLASFFNNIIIFGGLLWFNDFIKHRPVKQG